MAVRGGSPDWIRELAKKPPQVKIAIFLGIAAALGLVYYQFFYSGMRGELAKEERTRKREIKRQRTLDDQLRKRDALLAKKRLLDKEIARMQRALPTEAELPAFFEHLQKKAGDAGVVIRNSQGKAEKRVGQYVKVPVELEVYGSFHQLMHYFALLGPDRSSLQKRVSEAIAALKAAETKTPGKAEKKEPEDEKAQTGERIVTIEGLKLTRAKASGEGLLLKAVFTASTFRKDEQKGGKR